MSPLTELLDAPRLDGAACVGRGELFFAAPSEMGMAAEARAICATCPALADCREWITRHELDHPREHGIWAGLSMNQREGRANRHTTPCAECGRPMRSHNWDPVEWPGTVVAQGHGLCSACYLRHRKRDRHRSRKTNAKAQVRKCAVCGRSIRPCGALAATFPGTIAQRGKGLCGRCYTAAWRARNARTAA